MIVGVIGSGGREHAICELLNRSKKIKKLYCFPGNAGTAKIAINVEIDTNDFEGFKVYVLMNKIELVIVGPEKPLVDGLVDYLEKFKIKVFGPNKLASKLEGSKIVTKRICEKYNIPSAKFGVFKNIHEANNFLKKSNHPIVIKADNLASGKGVYICENLNESFEAGIAAANELNFNSVEKVNWTGKEEIEFTHSDVEPYMLGKKKVTKGSKHFIDFQNDVTAADIFLAQREGYISVEHTKRYTTTGMGTDQGKTSNVNALALMSHIHNKPVDEIGHTTFRPPYAPQTIGAIAGRSVDKLFDPERKTSMHEWHVENKAVFEDVGQWKRPYYFPQNKEDIHQAVKRECLAVRNSLGILDASTLGKIDLQGPDAAKFLNMIYTNAWSKLEIGSCRYGLMCNEHGMIFDDGVTSRLGENHYHMTTTTGGAARVMSWLEEFLQTEWLDMKVFCTSVTEQWAVLSISGPNSREFLEDLTNIDLSKENFPFMKFREGEVCGVKARIFRISFTGELSYEVNVPARYGRYVWEKFMEHGKKYNITPYGTETMHVLRAEKGFIIVGQDTDGSVTPSDMNMDWIVSKKKEDFLGKRSFTRPDTVRHDRKKFVGLLVNDKKTILPEGSHIVEKGLKQPPMKMLGHVTSSYYSPTLGYPIALAMLKDGFSKMGEQVVVPLMNGKIIEATVTDTIFYDKEGKRNNE